MSSSTRETRQIRNGAISQLLEGAVIREWLDWWMNFETQVLRIHRIGGYLNHTKKNNKKYTQYFDTIQISRRERREGVKREVLPFIL